MSTFLPRRRLLQQVAGAAAASAGLPLFAQERALVLGQSAPTSGPAAQLGIQMHHGLKLYFDQFNAQGGLAGRAVELRLLDDGYEPERCKANTEKLIADDVFALIGYVGTPTSLAALPLVNQKRLTPHATEILEHCKTQGYTMHLITNGFESTQRQKLQYAGIAHYFTELITSEKSQSMKPQAAIFNYALQAAGATAEESIMIGDALEIDILGAFYAGIDQVYYNPARTPHRHKPTYEVASLSELMEIF